MHRAGTVLIGLQVQGWINAKCRFMKCNIADDQALLVALTWPLFVSL